MQDGTPHSPGALPEGSYDILATFAEGGLPISAGTVRIQGGEQVTIDCRVAFMRCKVR